MRGDISSQFITGLLFALVHLGGKSSLRLLPPVESRPYIQLTLSALRAFGAQVEFTEDYRIEVKKSHLHALSTRIEGDESNAAFLSAFNELGSDVRVGNLNPETLQGDQVYREYFPKISEGTPTLDLSDCPDLGPILIALAAMKQGAVFTGTDRLRLKESDRGLAMHEELVKLGGGLIFEDNRITVPPQTLRAPDIPLCGHNDHRIVMALSVVLSQTGGTLTGAHAVNKSYPGFFSALRSLGADVTLEE